MSWPSGTLGTCRQPRRSTPALPKERSERADPSRHRPADKRVARMRFNVTATGKLADLDEIAQQNAETRAAELGAKPGDRILLVFRTEPRRVSSRDESVDAPADWYTVTYTV